MEEASLGPDSLVCQEHSLQLVENLRRIYDEEDCFLHDITLCSKDSGEVRAHKIILAAQSEYFKGMFRNEKKERIEMNISAETLRTVVKTLYTGKTVINIDNVQDLLEASNYLQIKDLNVKCVDFMARNLDASNCVGVLSLADQLSVERLLQEAVNFIGEHFQKLFETSEEFKQLPVELFAKCIKSDRIIIYSKYGTVLPAIQREQALVEIIVQYVKHSQYEMRVKDTWPLFRALKLPFIAHHLDFKEIGLSDLANFEDDPTLHSLIRSSRIPKEDDLRRRYSVDPFSKHNSHLRAFSVAYNIWTERFGAGPKSAYMEVRPFSCEGGPDKFIRTVKMWFRSFDDKKILGGLKLVWSNGSTDVAGETGETADRSGLVELEEVTAELGEGEHIQKLEIRSGWFIEGVKMTSNGGKVFGPWGGEGGDEKKPHKHIRKGVNPRHVYLDGIRGYVVRAQGAKTLNRVSFKWSFVMDKKVSRYSYHHSVVLRSESERISVLELERDINLTDMEEGAARRDWPPRFFPPPMMEGRMDAYQWSDEDEMWSPPNPPQAPQNAWQLNMQVNPEVVQVDQPIIEMEDESNGSGEEEAEPGQDPAAAW
eukprot:GFUD01024893.1.p1 GENE.GFUD01024893.1~~GFUD01024893.1.p1  ORF type:complete len:633 (+),score=228.00 GFUD01024893.1:113-1900(+)